MMHIIKCRIKQIALLLIVLALVVPVIYGCRAYKRGLVYKDWTRTMAELGIFPIFPPREDVQVGDVWLLPMHPLATDAVEAVGGLGHTGIWCDNSEGVSNLLTNFYNENRLSLTKLDTKPIEVIQPLIDALEGGKKVTEARKELKDLKIITVPTMDNDNDNIFTQRDVKRLRQVAFPEFAVTNITQAEMRVLIPIDYFSVAGGLKFDKVQQISLKIPSAESYGIPARSLMENFFKNKSIEHNPSEEEYILRLKEWDWDWKNTKKKNSNENKYTIIQDVPGVPGLTRETALLTRSMFNESFMNISRNTGLINKIKISKGLEESQNYIWVAIINEVFYARALDINVHTTKGRAGATYVKPITEEMLQELDRLKNIKKRSKEVKTEVGPGESTGVSEGTETRVGAITNGGASIGGNAGTGSDQGGRTKTITTEKMEEYDAFSIAEKMNNFNKNLESQSVLGGSVNVISVSETSVGLRRIFERPIAVGVRGFIMRINVNNVDPYYGFKVEIIEHKKL